MLISPSEIHHLVDVLRFSVGEEVQLLDGNGGRYLSQIETIAPSRVEFKILISKGRDEVTSSLQMTLAMALLKPQPMDFIIYKTT